MTTPVFIARADRLPQIVDAIRQTSPKAQVYTCPVGRKWSRISIRLPSNHPLMTLLWKDLYRWNYQDSPAYWSDPAHRKPPSYAFQSWRPASDPGVFALLATFRVEQKRTYERIVRAIRVMQKHGYNAAEIGAKLDQLAQDQSKMDERTIRKRVLQDPGLVWEGLSMSHAEQMLWWLGHDGNKCRVAGAHLPHFRYGIEASYQRIASSILSFAPP